MRASAKWTALGLLGGMALVGHEPRAAACGCFAQPSVATPVVQAGERILFAHEGQNVVAYIQIQYKGSADQFGWLVPLPSVPTLELGTDEVFTKLGAATQPTYTLTRTNQCTGFTSSTTSSGGGGGCGFGDDTAAGSYAVPDLGVFASSADMGSSVVVVKSSIGPFDYVVLKADDQTEMLKWLNDNHYFVPDATGRAVTPYIHPNAFFLALKLRAGESAGDVVPVVLRYKSDLPMIPITLTSVGAIPNMGILVWELGHARAIPRNYHHTVLNDIPIWGSSASYSSLVIDAIHEAPNKHSFITEYAGSSSVMAGQLYYTGRFGDLTTLRGLGSPSRYLGFLKQNGFTFDSTLFALLEKYIPEPVNLIQQGVTQYEFYTRYDSFIADERAIDGGAEASFDGAALTDEINMRIVVPTQKTQALFDAHRYLTRLYTNLSPEDMNADPVFSENPDLRDVPARHNATLTTPCSGAPWLTSETGVEVQWPGGFPPTTVLPSSRLIETLRETGQPQIDTDNTVAIRTAVGPVSHGTTDRSSSAGTPSGSGSGGGGCGCNVAHRSRFNLGWLLLLACAALVGRRVHRRAKQ